MFLQRLSSISLFVGLVVLMSSCANQFSHVQPQAQINSTRVQNLSFDSITLGVVLDITNPNNFSIPLGNLDLGLLIDGNQIAQAQATQGQNLAARQKTQIEVPVQLPYSSLFSLATGFRNSNQFDFELAGSLGIPVPVIGDVVLPLSYQGSAPIPQPPRLSISDLVLTDIGITRSSMDLFLQIDNPNLFPINLSGMALDLKANDRSLINAATVEGANLAAGQSNTVRVPLSFSTANAGLSLYQSILSSNAIQWQVEGQGDLSGDFGLNQEGFDFSFNELLSAFR